MLAVDPPTNTFEFYHLQGNLLSKTILSTGASYNYQWFPDSSAIVVWGTNADATALPVLTIDPSGTVAALHLTGQEGMVSSDGEWIAASDAELVSAAQSTSVIMLINRAGTVAQTVAQSANSLVSSLNFLGWNGDNVIYDANGTLWSYSPLTLQRRSLGADQVAEFSPPLHQNLSPDGTALLVQGRIGNGELIIDAHSVPLPAGSLFPEGVQWADTHRLFAAVTDGTLSIVDPATQTAQRLTIPGTSNTIAAVSGPWVAVNNRDMTVFFYDLQTQQHRLLTGLPTPDLQLFPLSPNQFLGFDPTETIYRFDPSLIP